ncbi:hypothetical protein HMPREF9374_2630 [Desmospora sp. 8437]|uniref:Uncharacterized protein n=1 Tax=Kroppenstedtia guangzhouensis TaxID=1274356 RepID=A0ABQ1H3E7_9BACL|nr:hypothetical protein HMPREF9374_2630 [Desmospora sp. 8437]GGA57416.1 hypothetical protein GCM10007416_33310 [Kroppenstedtia guangzhouensis]
MIFFVSIFWLVLFGLLVYGLVKLLTGTMQILKERYARGKLQGKSIKRDDSQQSGTEQQANCRLKY